MKQVKVEVNLPVSVFREGKSFIAYTPALDLSTCGKNYDEAKKRFNEAVEIFFEETLKKGTLSEVLQELGWKRVKTKWMPPAVVSQELESVKVPLSA
ncbi:type II toxin-antitoxin system HicB family antitoxin [Patescibacteria group bacterium AH-259-L07]|nr:type II toxin-antitoxin system HicB family antitoxin [Patescibacteria group bacterium AH-259-L07]